MLTGLLVSLGAGGCLLDDPGEPEPAPAADGGSEDSGDGGAATSEGDLGDGALDDTGSGGATFDCIPAYAVEGSIGGTDASYSDYATNSVFFNKSLEEVALSGLDLEIMKEIGLNPEDPEDQERFAYFFSGFDLRSLYVERLDETYGWQLSKVGRDLSVALFDLAEHDVQPGTPVAIFDVSPLEAVRNSGDRDALAAMLRELVDQMRSNGQPDAVVTFAPDRSAETLGESLFISMLSPNARFASSGTARFDELLDIAGDPMEQLEYPNEAIARASFAVDAQFGDEPLTLDATCMETRISG